MLENVKDIIYYILYIIYSKNFDCYLHVLMRKLNSEFLNSESMPLNCFHNLTKKVAKNNWLIQKFFVTLQCQREEMKLQALIVEIAGINSCNGRH